MKRKTNTVKFPKTVNLCGIAYEVVIMPKQGTPAGNQFRKKIDLDKNAVAGVDNDDRIIFFEEGRVDIGYLMMHELVHAATEIMHPDPNTKEFEKFYGEAWTRAFSRVLYDMLKNMGMLDKNFH